jgi:hypothetical protein
MAPEMGFHSVIDRPESVSRVAPPTTTMPNTIKAVTSSQRATRRERSDINIERMAVGLDKNGT